MTKTTLGLLITLLALALLTRALVLNRFLPVSDYIDEANMYNLALDWRGGELAYNYGTRFVRERLISYPPLYVEFNALVQEAIDSAAGGQWRPLGAYLYVLRLFSLAAGALTAVLIALAAWELGGKWAGWLAGLIWALLPAIYETNNLAIPDSFVYLACAAALLLAIHAWRRSAPAALLGSLLAGIAAIYLKYTPVYALLPWGVALAVLTLRQPRRMLPWLVVQGALALAAAAWLVLGYGALALNNGEANVLRDQGAALISPKRIWNNAQYAFIPVGGALLLALALGLAWLGARRRLPWGWIALLLVYAASGIIASAATMSLERVFGHIRHVLPAALALIVVLALCVTQIARGLPRRGLRMAVMIGATLAISVPALGQSAALIASFNVPDSRVLLWRWSDASIPPDGLIMTDRTSPLSDAWNRAWRGYDGVTAFQWWQEANFWEADAATYPPRGITYVAIDGSERERLADAPQVNHFLGQLTRLKTFPASPVSSEIDVYRIQPPQYTADVTFGDQIRLVGYDLDLTEARSGGTLVFRPYWRAPRQPQVNYSLFVHLAASADSALIAQQDGPPVSLGRLTSTWNDPDELLIGATAALAIPPDTAPGDYLLSVGLYDFIGGARLTTADGADHFGLPVTIHD